MINFSLKKVCHILNIKSLGTLSHRKFGRTLLLFFVHYLPKFFIFIILYYDNAKGTFVLHLPKYLLDITNHTLSVLCM